MAPHKISRNEFQNIFHPANYCVFDNSREGGHDLEQLQFSGRGAGHDLRTQGAPHRCRKSRIQIFNFEIAISQS